MGAGLRAPGRGGLRRRRDQPHRLAVPGTRGVGRAGVGQRRRPELRRAGADHRHGLRPAPAGRGRTGRDAPGRPAGLHLAPGPAGWAPPAHRLQRADQPARQQLVVVGLRGDRPRVPPDALPAGAGPREPLGPLAGLACRSGPAQRGRPRHRAAGRHRRRRARRARTARRPHRRPRGLRLRLRGRWQQRHPDREPDGRPAPRPAPRRGRRPGPDHHRRPEPRPPADLGPQPVLRRAVQLRRPRRPRREPRRRTAAAPGGRQRLRVRRPHDVLLRRQHHRRLPVAVAADAGTDLRDRRARRLALRPQHPGLPGQRRRPDHRRDELLDDGGPVRLPGRLPEQLLDRDRRASRPS